MVDEKKPKKEKPAEKSETKPPTTEAPAETKSDTPKNYSRGEGQKPITQAYRENWDVIFGKKKGRPRT
jgi:hypothetical protein